MKLEEYINEQLISFNQNLKKAIKDTDIEALHDLRLAVKRLAIIKKVTNRYLPHISKSFHKQYKQIIIIFKQTGVIRDNQIVKKLYKQYMPKKEGKKFIKYIDADILVAKEVLNNLYNHFSAKEIKKAVLKPFKQISAKDFFSYKAGLKKMVDKNEKQIAHLIESSNCNFHEVRTLVKEQYYLLLQLKHVLGCKVSSKKVRQKKKISNLLGEWHDLIVLKDKVSKSGCQLSSKSLNKIDRQKLEILIKSGLL